MDSFTDLIYGMYSEIWSHVIVFFIVFGGGLGRGWGEGVLDTGIWCIIMMTACLLSNRKDFLADQDTNQNKWVMQIATHNCMLWISR